MNKLYSFLLAVLLVVLFSTGTALAQFADHRPLYSRAHALPMIPAPVQVPASRYIDSTIVQTIALMNPDTVRKNLLTLQHFGSRFMGRDDRKQVAEWIAGQFLSYGYTDVRLDSFLCMVNWPGYLVDTLWQYNVVARLVGASAPDEIYVIGGHYDSFSYEDPYNDAPGADDNGSATIVAMEAARVMKLAGYQPAATIEFTLWAAEELGLFGSKYLASVARETNRDIRYVLNLDMVANNPDSLPQVIVGKYEPDTWAADAAAFAYSTYTGLEPVIPEDPNPSGSDSYSYYQEGFPAIFVQEIEFSPNWHHISDTVGNCNIAYLTDVARGACATLMDQQDHPYVPQVTARSYPDRVGLTWKGTANADIAGYNVYRAAPYASFFSLINIEPVTDTFYNDLTAVKGEEYFYRIASIHPLYGESLPSLPVSGAIYHFSDTLLIVNQLHLNEETPDSIRQFYQAVMDTIPYEWFDLNTNDGFGIDLLATHKNILWMTNTVTFQTSLAPAYGALSDFFSNGGNMMISGFYPAKMTGLLGTYPLDIPEGTILRDFFKTDSVDSKNACMMYRAYPVSDDYDTLRIDDHKSMVNGYPGEICRVESYIPVAGGTVIYRLDSHYPSTSQLGSMQDKPVGLEYMGTDFRTILLGFPLYYLDTADAKALMKEVMTNKFTHPTGIVEPGTLSDRLHLSARPNPFNHQATLTFTLDTPGDTRLFVVNMQGVVVRDLINARLNSGDHQSVLYAGDMPPGIYQVVLITAHGSCARSIIHVR